MIKLTLVRHGQSLWNLENRFTGWHDIDLSEQGMNEARWAAQQIADAGLDFDMAFASVLTRSIRTLWIILDGLKLTWLPVTKAWQLNERHYGGLQGLNKAETTAKHGEGQVKIWRRSYDIRPPKLSEDNPGHPRFDRRYAGVDPDLLPCHESLKDTLARVIPYWEQNIVPQLRQNKRIMIVAHGNSLRALVKHLDNISDEEITQLNIPTGIPLVYELDNQLKPLKHYYLGDEQAVQNAINKVANEASKK